MRIRTGMIGAALVALTAVGTAGVVTSVAAVEEPAEKISGDFVRWKTLNGGGNKHFQVFADGGPVSDKQDYTSGNPWELESDPELVTVSAEGGVPLHFGGRQRHGVRSEGESGGNADTISGDEVLIISAGNDLADLFSGFTDLRVQAQGDVSVGVIAKRNGNVVAETSIPHPGDGSIVPIQWDVDGKKADSFEFFNAGESGRFGFKGFTTDGRFPQFNLVASDAFVVTPGNPAVTELPGQGPDEEVTATTSCLDLGDGVTGCDAKGGQIQVTQSLSEIGGVTVLDVIPEIGNPEDPDGFLETRLVVESALLPDLANLEVDFDALDGDDEFVNVTPCGALPGGFPSSTGTKACLQEVIISAGALPIITEYVFWIAADPRFRGFR